MTIRRAIRLGLLATASLLAMAVPAAADPITAVLSTFVGSALASALVSAGVTTAVNIGLSLLSQALFGKTPSRGGSVSSVQIAAEVPRQIIFGRAKTQGHVLYIKGVGKKNKTVHVVYGFADWECDSLEKIWVAGVEKSLTSVSPVGTEHARFTVDNTGGSMVVKFFRGTLAQTADTELITASGQSGATSLGPWTSDHRLAGICYAVVVSTFDEDNLPSLPLQIDFQIKGAKLYDWRKDSTNGGSGAHRWNDATTWEWSGNPAVCDYNFRRGFYRGSTRVLGMGVPSSDLLHSLYTAAANVCDEAVTEGGGSELRYTCGAIVQDGDEWGDSVNIFKLAMAGDVVERAGQFGVLAGAAYSSVMTITDDDMRDMASSAFSRRKARSELYNSVTISYLEPILKWDSFSLTPLTNATWEGDDGGERIAMPVDLPMVYKPYQAYRIGTIVHNQSRRQAVHTGFYPATFSALEPGDWVTRQFNRDGYGTYTMKVSSIREVKDDPEWYEIGMVEVAAADYTGSVVTIPVVTTPGTAVTYDPPAAPAKVAADSSAFIAPDGTTVTSLDLSWPAVTDAVVQSYRLGVTLLGEAVPTLRYDFTASADGWTAGAGTITPSGGIVSLAITGNQGRVISPSGLTIVGATYTKIIARLRRTAGTGWNGNALYTTAGHSFVGSYYRNIADPFTAPSEWVVAEWDMAALTAGGTDWITNTITRFDIRLSNTSGDAFDIDWVAVVGLTAAGATESVYVVAPSGADPVRYTVPGVKPNSIYAMRVAAVDIDGDSSAWTAAVNTMTAVDRVAPSVASGLAATALFRGALLLWTPPAERDIAYAEIWSGTTNNRASATKVAETRNTSYVHQGLAIGTARYYWLRYIDTSGNVGDWHPTSATAGVAVTPLGYSAIDTATGTTVFASGTSLPSSGNFQDRLFVLLPAEVLYVYRNGAWAQADKLIAASQVTCLSLSTLTANVGILTAGLIRSGASGMILDLDNNLIRSGTYAEDANGTPTAGFKGDGATGTLSSFSGKFSDINALGATFTKRPVISTAPIFSNGIMLSEQPAAVSSLQIILQSPSAVASFVSNTGMQISNVSFQRFPNYIRFTGGANDGTKYLTFDSLVSIAPGDLLPTSIDLTEIGTSKYISFKRNGTIKLIDYNATDATDTTTYDSVIAHKWMYDVERDPLNLAGATKVVAGLGVSRRPFPWVIPACSKLKFKVWGAGGGYDRGTAGVCAGPGAYVYAEFDVGATKIIRAGDVLWLIPGQGGIEFSQVPTLGYGGAGYANRNRMTGGGGSFVFRHSIDRTNILIAAGGGGAGRDDQGGSPGGHTTWAGGQTGSGFALMTGAPYVVASSRQKSAGGGGYTGGTYLTNKIDGTNPASGSRGGKGGTSFVHADGLSTSLQYSAANANGYATTRSPPNAADADYTANSACWMTRALVGEGIENPTVGTHVANGESGGNGLIVIEIVP